ncbi:sialic acid TRAP transporter substrate-binding protein SiaP [Streptomyces sanglieri]
MRKENNTQGRRGFIKGAAAVSAVGTVGLAGCLGDDGEETIQVNSPAGEESIQGLIPTWFSEYVDEINEGLEVEVFYGGELGGHAESVDNVVTGGLDMYVSGIEIFSGHYEMLDLFAAPYLYEDFDHLLEATDPDQSDAADEIFTQYREETGVRIIGPAIQGTRRVTTSDTEVYEPSDLEGLTLRSPGPTIYVETVSGLGASVTEVDQPEIPTALAQGTVDGQENPYSIIYGDGIYEHQQYIIETDHMITPMAIHMNEDVFQGLSDTHQDVLLEAEDMMVEHAVSWLEDEIDDIKDTMREEGLEIIEHDEIDAEAFQESVLDNIYDAYDDEFLELAADISPNYE